MARTEVLSINGEDLYPITKSEAVYHGDDKLSDVIGNTDISAIGDGTITGAVSNINDRIDTMKTNFQAGCDKIASAITAKGGTVASNDMDGLIAGVTGVINSSGNSNLQLLDDAELTEDLHLKTKFYFNNIYGGNMNFMEPIYGNPTTEKNICYVDTSTVTSIYNNIIYNYDRDSTSFTNGSRANQFYCIQYNDDGTGIFRQYDINVELTKSNLNHSDANTIHNLSTWAVDGITGTMLLDKSTAPAKCLYYPRISKIKTTSGDYIYTYSITKIDIVDHISKVIVCQDIASLPELTSIIGSISAHLMSAQSIILENGTIHTFIIIGSQNSTNYTYTINQIYRLTYDGQSIIEEQIDISDITFPQSKESIDSIMVFNKNDIGYIVIPVKTTTTDASSSTTSTTYGLNCYTIDNDTGKLVYINSLEIGQSPTNNIIYSISRCNTSDDIDMFVDMGIGEIHGISVTSTGVSVIETINSTDDKTGPVYCKYNGKYHVFGVTNNLFSTGKYNDTTSMGIKKMSHYVINGDGSMTFIENIPFSIYRKSECNISIDMATNDLYIIHKYGMILKYWEESSTNYQKLIHDSITDYIAESCVITDDTYIYILGGAINPWVWYKYDPTSNTLLDLGDLPVPVYDDTVVERPTGGNICITSIDYDDNMTDLSNSMPDFYFEYDGLSWVKKSKDYDGMTIIIDNIMYDVSISSSSLRLYYNDSVSVRFIDISLPQIPSDNSYNGKAYFVYNNQLYYLLTYYSTNTTTIDGQNEYLHTVNIYKINITSASYTLVSSGTLYAKSNSPIGSNCNLQLNSTSYPRHIVDNNGVVHLLFADNISYTNSTSFSGQILVPVDISIVSSNFNVSTTPININNIYNGIMGGSGYYNYTYGEKTWVVSSRTSSNYKYMKSTTQIVIYKATPVYINNTWYYVVNRNVDDGTTGSDIHYFGIYRMRSEDDKLSDVSRIATLTGLNITKYSHILTTYDN